jgi:ornithine cyclodeaminase/alanine dehydrogenase-like protein (mu-crystallin family)
MEMGLDREWVAKKLRIGQEFVYLTQEQVKSAGLDDGDILDLTEKALVAHGRKRAEMPAKIGLHPLKDTLMHAMPAYLPESAACGIKWASCFPANRDRFGLLQTSGLIIFNDSESGWPLAVMDAIWITEKRTPAVTCVAARHMASADTVTFGMLGCGVQGKAHVGMIERVLGHLETITVFDVYEPAMDHLVDELQPKVKARIVKAKSFEELVKSSQVVASATAITSRPEPKIRDEWVSAGQTLLMCDMHSLYEDATMKRADKYFLDSIEEHELFEGYGYYPDGLPHICGETGEVAAGLKKGRENTCELVACNNVGMAVEDMMVARTVFERALEASIGTMLAL